MKELKLTVKMASGSLAATSSMSMPPLGLPTMTGPPWALSIRIAKYVSRSMSRASATITLERIKSCKLGCWTVSQKLIDWKNILFVGSFGFLTPSSTTRLHRRRVPKSGLTILRAATHETEWGDHDFCLSRSHYTDTNPTRRERAEWEHDSARLWFGSVWVWSVIKFTTSSPSQPLLARDWLIDWLILTAGDGGFYIPAQRRGVGGGEERMAIDLGLKGTEMER